MTQVQNPASSYVIGDMILADPVSLLGKQTNATGWIRFTHCPRSRRGMFIFLLHDTNRACTLWAPVTSLKQTNNGKDGINKYHTELDMTKMPALRCRSLISNQEVWAIPDSLFVMDPPRTVPSADPNYVKNVVIPWCQNAIDRLTK